MNEYWDSREQWVDESRCIVCKTPSAEFVCSATCEDVQDWLRNHAPVLDWENLGEFIAQQHEPSYC